MTHKGTVEIKTERLTLRRFTMEDAEPAYRNWTSNPDVTKFLMWPTHENIDVTRAVLSDWINKYEQDDFYLWAIVLKELNEPIGSISSVHGNDKIKMVHIGYCIGKQWWQKGYTSEALAALIKFFFEEVGVNRVESRHDPINPNSGKVMQKCGLMYEGTMREADWNNQGICDYSEYGILAKDYFSR